MGDIGSSVSSLIKETEKERVPTCMHVRGCPLWSANGKTVQLGQLGEGLIFPAPWD